MVHNSLIPNNTSELLISDHIIPFYGSRKLSFLSTMVCKSIYYLDTRLIVHKGLIHCQWHQSSGSQKSSWTRSKEDHHYYKAALMCAVVRSSLVIAQWSAWTSNSWSSIDLVDICLCAFKTVRSKNFMFYLTFLRVCGCFIWFLHFWCWLQLAQTFAENSGGEIKIGKFVNYRLWYVYIKHWILSRCLSMEFSFAYGYVIRDVHCLYFMGMFSRYIAMWFHIFDIWVPIQIFKKRKVCS